MESLLGGSIGRLRRDERPGADAGVRGACAHELEGRRSALASRIDTLIYSGECFSSEPSSGDNSVTNFRRFKTGDQIANSQIANSQIEVVHVSIALKRMKPDWREFHMAFFRDGMTCLYAVSGWPGLSLSPSLPTSLFFSRRTPSGDGHARRRQRSGKWSAQELATRFHSPFVDRVVLVIQGLPPADSDEGEQALATIVAA